MTSNPKFSKEDIRAIRNTPDGVRRLYVKQAITAETDANKKTWQSCLWCWRIAGKYQEGGVIGLANDLGRSTDTIYDRAHAYEMFDKVCHFDDGKYRSLAFYARRSTYITWSHFRALWDAQRLYNLMPDQVIWLLVDIVSAEGEITSRGVDGHVRSKYGVDRGWEYYGKKALQSISKALNDPDLPQDVRKPMLELFNKLGERS